MILDEFEVDSGTDTLWGTIEVIDGRWAASLFIDTGPGTSRMPFRGHHDGWFSEARTLASRSNLARRSGSSVKACGKTLSATAPTAHAASDPVRLDDPLVILARIRGRFNRSSQHLNDEEFAMGTPKRRRSLRAGRPPMRSPGRPTAGRREHRRRFWDAIACGLSSEEAALAAGVSQPVGTLVGLEPGPATLAELAVEPRVALC